MVADAGYGVATEFREALTNRGIPYVLGVLNTITVWPEGEQPLPPLRWKGVGRPPVRIRRNELHRPIDLRAVARALPSERWEEVSWREGTKGVLSSRFARTRVRVVLRDYRLRAPRSEEWLLLEWPEGAKAPTKYWLSTMPPETTMELLVQLAKVRWRIERDYPELKGEFGLDHFEGRGWRGFHHHATLCIAAYGFLATERARLSPPQPLAFLQAARPPRGFRPRGSPGPTRATHRKLDHDAPSPGRPLGSSGIPAARAGAL